MALTAADGLRSVPHLRKAQVRGVDLFETACKVSGEPGKVHLPESAMNGLVAANIEYVLLDRTHTAVSRILGIPVWNWVDGQAAVPCKFLSETYDRISTKLYPRGKRICAVTPIVRCTLRVCMRKGGPISTVDLDALTPAVEDEMRLDSIGVLLLPTPRKAVKWMFYTALVSASLIISLSYGPVIRRVDLWTGDRTQIVRDLVMQACTFAIALSSLSAVAAVLFQRSAEKTRRSGKCWSTPIMQIVLLAFLLR